MSNFTFKNEHFLLDGEPFQVISGAMHYWRIVPEYWEDRLKKLRACGFNTVETYVAWNLHERKEGVFDFSGNLDIVKYIEIAESLGLKVIVRSGTVHLLRVRLRRTSVLAARLPADAPQMQRPDVPRKGQTVLPRASDQNPPASLHERRRNHHGSDRKRVRLLRRRQGIPESGRRYVPRVRHRLPGSSLPTVRATGC